MHLAPLLALAALAVLPQDAPKKALDESNQAEWADFIRPSDTERSFEDIGWRNTFWPAIEEARRIGRPVLLWTMNGHPLGCT